jgi:hypothetical protein
MSVPMKRPPGSLSTAVQTPRASAGFEQWAVGDRAAADAALDFAARGAERGGVLQPYAARTGTHRAPRALSSPRHGSQWLGRGTCLTGVDATSECM